MAPGSQVMLDDERETLVPSPTPTLRANTPSARRAVHSYGATADGLEGPDEEQDGVPVKSDPVIKVNREFKEIWAMCLGLATA